MKVSDLSTPDPLVVAPDTPLDEVAELMDRHSLRHLPVQEGAELVGLVSDRDLMAMPPGAERTGDVMTAPAVTVSPDQSVVAASLEMILRKIGCLVVAEGSTLQGILTETDLLAAFSERVAAGGMAGKVDPDVTSCMTRDMHTISHDASLTDAVATLREHDIRHLPVVDDGGRLVGMLSDRDLRRAVSSADIAEWRARDGMSSEVVRATSETPMSHAAELMTSYRISALPVVEDSNLLGILTVSDMLDHFLEALREADEVG